MPAPRRRALVTMFNVAEWGGLHENVLHSAFGMAARGWDLTVACREGLLVDLLRAGGIDVHVVADWDDWSHDAEVLSAQKWDLIHSHPVVSRELALEVSERTGVPLISTFHGFNRDLSYRWHRKARSFIAVSRAHADMLVHGSKIPGHKVFVVPNAVPDHAFDVQPRSWEERTRDGHARVVVASRLDPDKKNLLAALEEVTEAISADDRGLRWTIELAGDGRAAAEVDATLEKLASRSSAITFERLGWVDHRKVQSLFSDAVLTICPGRAAQLSLATGTPTVAFGSRGLYGLQHGTNLQVGLWGNFGGFPLDDVAITSVPDDLAWLLSSIDNYDAVVTQGREVAEGQLRQSHADDLLAAIYAL